MALGRTPTIIRFDPEVYEWLRKRSYETKTPISALVREAVDTARKSAREGKKAVKGA